MPTQPTVLEFVAAPYRQIDAWELAQLKQAYPNEVALREKLERLKRSGGVESHLSFNFFLAAIDKESA
jgi:hypothetical protein